MSRSGRRFRMVCWWSLLEKVPNRSSRVEVRGALHPVAGPGPMAEDRHPREAFRRPTVAGRRPMVACHQIGWFPGCFVTIRANDRRRVGLHLERGFAIVRVSLGAVPDRRKSRGGS